MLSGKIFGPVAACLCVAILFLAMTAPQQSQVSAGDVQQKRADIAVMESMLANIVKSVEGQAQVNQSTQDQVAALADAVSAISDSMVDRTSVVKLVADTVADSQPTKAEMDCDCADKLADLQKQIDDLKARLAAVEARPAYATSGYAASSAPVKSGGSTGSVKSGGSTGSVVQSSPVVTSSSYQPRWQNHDGLSRAEHAAVYHGLNTAGMTEAQINAQLDADHDQHGPMHDGILASRTRSVTRSVQSTSNCPGGRCPTGPTTSRSSGGGLLGLGLFRSRR